MKFRAAYYDDALDLLQGCEDWDAPVNEEAVCLKAEILNRRNPLASLQELANSQDIFQSPRGSLNYVLALGRGYASSANFDAAEAMYRKARKLLVGADADMLPRVALQESRLQWMRGQFDPESVEIIHALQDTTPRGKMSALFVRAWMHGGLERYDRMLIDFSAALKIVEESPAEQDAYAIAKLLLPYLRVAMETGSDAHLASGKAAFEQLAWTPDIQSDQFQCVRVLGWNAFVKGEAIRAQRYFKQAHALAPSRAWEAMAHLDRAHVALGNKNELWAMEETAEAEEIAKDVTWASTRGEERFVLLTLAVLVSKYDMAQAQTYVALYNQIGKSSVSPTLSLVRDRRSIADERYASGCVQQVLGNPELALSMFEEAYNIFSSIGYEYRATLAALSLFEISGDATWQTRGNEHGKRFPGAPQPVGPVEPSEPDDEIFGSLTPTQKQVLAAICEGLPTAALEVSISRQTYVPVVYCGGETSGMGAPTRDFVHNGVALGER